MNNEEIVELYVRAEGLALKLTENQPKLFRITFQAIFWELLHNELITERKAF